MDELHKAVEVGQRPYQNILKVIISAGVIMMLEKWKQRAIQMNFKKAILVFWQSALF